jgi:hypothetical protein
MEGSVVPLLTGQKSEIVKSSAPIFFEKLKRRFTRSVNTSRLLSRDRRVMPTRDAER